ncbi:membrane fusion protein, multidrug efflux system [uncultured Gammaproteobacteria bacterium]
MNKGIRTVIAVAGVLALTGGAWLTLGPEKIIALVGSVTGDWVGDWVGAAKPLGGAGPGGGGPGGAGPGGFAMAVEAGPVRVGAVAREVTAVGSLISRESVIIRSELAGRIAEIAFAEGTAVHKGEVLLRLDDSIPRATLAQAQASLALSRAEAARADELFGKGSGTASARDKAQAKLLVDQAELALDRAKLDKLTLSAPFAGIVGLRKISVGDYVKEGQDIVNLEAIDSLKLDFSVPEAYLPVVRTGQTLAVVVDALPGRSFPGEVMAIDPKVDVNGRSVMIRAKVNNADQALRPGLFARVTLRLTVNPNALLVPEQALMAMGSDQFVFKVVEGKAKQTRVKIGARRNAEVEIVDGLAAGEMVVLAGQIKLREGMAVTVQPSAKP